MNQASSTDWFTRAIKVLPGGVNSPVRAFQAVGGVPPFITRGSGSRIYDVDGRKYIDYVASYGPLLFGHAPAFLVEAIEKAVRDGTTFGAPCPAEVEIAEEIARLVPGIEMVRFVSSGSEATTSAIRLARGATGRRFLVKCAGCYHGSVDSMLVSAGSGLATLGIPDSAGVSPSLAAETFIVAYNDTAALETIFEKHGPDIAAFILEPVAANMGVVLPAEGYLQAARDITRKHGSLLIFDEVITGFRLAPGGAQEYYSITPDITCLGKIIGGGIPCGAYGASRDLMEHIAPRGPVYQAGTLSGNPLAMNAGLAMLRHIQSEGPALYDRLDQMGGTLEKGIRTLAEKNGVPIHLSRAGSILTPFFTGSPVRDYPAAKASDTKRFASFFHALLQSGIYIAPSQFEAMFLSTAHTPDDLEQTLQAIATAFENLKNSSA